MTWSSNTYQFKFQVIVQHSQTSMLVKLPEERLSWLMDIFAWRDNLVDFHVICIPNCWAIVFTLLEMLKVNFWQPVHVLHNTRYHHEKCTPWNLSLPGIFKIHYRKAVMKKEITPGLSCKFGFWIAKTNQWSQLKTGFPCQQETNEHSQLQNNSVYSLSVFLIWQQMEFETLVPNL